MASGKAKRAADAVPQPLICLLMLVRDEQDVIRETLELALPHVDEVVVLDTGSVDATLPRLREVQVDHPNRAIHVCQSPHPFRDFATARNELLDEARARSRARFFLSLDASDRIAGGALLRSWLHHYQPERGGGAPVSVFLVQLESNRVVSMAPRVFGNHPRLQYRWPVHEYLCDAESGDMCVRAVVPGHTRIMHDRPREARKTRDRLPHDKAMLLAHLPVVLDDPTLKQRAWYYIAQTCFDMGDHSEALFWLEQRMQEEGKNKEEYYLSVVRWAYVQLLVWQQDHAPPVPGSSGALSEPDRYAVVLQRLVHAYGMYPQRAEALYYVAYIYGYMVAPRNVAYAYVLASEVCRKSEMYGCANSVQAEIYDFLRWEMQAHLACMMRHHQVATTAVMTALGYKHITREKRAELYHMLSVCKAQQQPETGV